MPEYRARTTAVKAKITGCISIYLTNRGFGFVHVHENGRLFQYFLHIKNVVSGEPATDKQVRFIPDRGTKGLQALEIEVIDGSAE